MKILFYLYFGMGGVNISDLVGKGIIQADMVRIDINDILYLLKDGGEVKEIGPDINSIT